MRQDQLNKEILDTIYDTLMENDQFPQLDPEKISDQKVTPDGIKFNYILDKQFTEDQGITNIEPIEEVAVTIYVDVERLTT